MAAARAKVERGIAPLFAGDDDPAAGDAHAHLLGHLLGIEWPASSHLQGILQDPKQIRNRAFHAAALVVRRTAERATGPLVVLVEDLHWADDESLDFLSYLLDVNRDVPMLVLAAMRPTLLERRPDWLATGSRQHRRVDLAPLDPRASRELTHALMRKLPDVPPALRDLVTDAAEGNPFYIEELVQMLIDQGVIATGATGWTLQAETLQATRLPATLTGVLQTRLDGLPAAERLALQQASVIGPVFWDRALAALDAQAAAALPELVRRELVLARPGSAVDGFAEYAFKHHLLQQVAYGTVLKRARRELHGRLATWLTAEAEHGGVRAGDVLALIAHHFEAAADDARAAEFHARAAEHAAERFAHAAVLLHADRALALLDGIEARDGTTTPARAARSAGACCSRARDEQPAGPASRATPRPAGARGARAVHRPTIGGVPRWRCAAACSRASTPTGPRRNATRATPCAGRAPRATTRSGCMRRSDSRSRCAGHGQLDDASTLAKAGLAEASERGLQRIVWGYFRTLALITESQGDEVESAEMEREALRIACELGDRIGEAIGLDCMGQVAILFGDLAEAQRVVRGRDSHAARARPAQPGSARAGVPRGGAAVARRRGARARRRAPGARDGGRVRGALCGSVGAVPARGSARGARAAWRSERRRSRRLVRSRATWASGWSARRWPASRAPRWRKATSHRHSVTFETLLAGPQPDAAAPDTTFHPELVALTCHEVLARAGDPRAAGWLEQARRSAVGGSGSNSGCERSGKRMWRRCRIGARLLRKGQQHSRTRVAKKSWISEPFAVRSS